MRSAIDCISTLKVGLAEDFEKYLSQVLLFFFFNLNGFLLKITPLESKKLENAVCQLDDFTKRLEQYANLGIVKLCDAAFRTKLKSGFVFFMVK